RYQGQVWFLGPANRLPYYVRLRRRRHRVLHWRLSRQSAQPPRTRGTIRRQFFITFSLIDAGKLPVGLSRLCRHLGSQVYVFELAVDPRIVWLEIHQLLKQRDRLIKAPEPE